MRIILANENKGWGGAEEHTLRLALELKNRGHMVLLITSPDSMLAKRADISNLPLRCIKMRSEVDLLAIGAIATLLITYRADILHTVGTRDHVLGSMAAILTGTPVVKVEHTFLADTSSALCMLIYKHLTTRVVCVCGAQQKHLLNNRIPSTRIETITNGIDPEYYRVETKACATAQVIAVIASCIPSKGHDVLISTIQHLCTQYPDLLVLCAGAGTMQKYLIELSVSAGVSKNFRWLGHVDDIRPVLASADILVHPSLHEVLPYAIMEAMACAIPVVAANVGGVADLVVDGITGMLVRPGDKLGLADAISNLLNDKTMIRKMGAAGRSRVMDKFAFNRMVSDYESLYIKICKKQKAGSA